MVTSEKSASFAVTALFMLATWTLVGPCAAQSQWLAVPAIDAPPANPGVTFVPWNDDEMLLFGGDPSNPTATDWSWDGVEWRSVTTIVPRRVNHAMAHDPATGDLLLFGGSDGVTLLNDTWRYANGVWTQLFPATSPFFAGLPELAFDPADDSWVLITGIDHWRFRNGNWLQLSGSAPSGGGRRLATDSVRGEVLLLVSVGAAPELYRLEGDVWVSAAPLAQQFATALTFDGLNGRAIVTGPGSSQSIATEQWDGLALTTQPNTSIGSPVAIETAAWHPARRETLLLGAVGPGATTYDLFRWAPAPSPLVAAYGTPCVDPTLQLGLVAGDSPQPGASHRLEVTGATGSFVTLLDLGLGHTQFGGLPLPLAIPLGAAGCLLRIDASVFSVLGLGLPQTSLVSFPNSPSLLGARYDAQAILFDAGGVSDTSNGLEVQLGLPPIENRLIETFDLAANRDPQTSGDTWGGGTVQPTTIGGDGRHGSFDATLGQQVEPDVYTWNTDSFTIPASTTLSGNQELITDGRFFFTDLVVPAGITVRFVGTSPAQLFVRGRVDVQGTLCVDADGLPFVVPTSGPATGLRVSTFNARTSPGGLGQTGGAGGAGGGRGGDGAMECLNTGPIIVGGVDLTDGQPGEDVRLSAGHAYAASATATGGRGGLKEPATGISPILPSSQLIINIWLPFISPGGGGGGHSLAGTSPTVPILTSGLVPLLFSTPVAGGVAFPVLPFPAAPPPGYSSLEHFSVGGSGGGGGGSHGYGLFGFATAFERWMAGSAGAGGGGVLVLRAGGDVEVSGVLSSRGGRGVLINGDDPLSFPRDSNNGISSPGGGGSGGSLLLQGAF